MYSGLRAILAADEEARADRYRLERDRRRFVVRRAVLRLGLVEWLDLPPERLRFGYGAEGKPHLRYPDVGLQFNLSHSEGLAVYACALGRPVGIDIERVRAHRDLGAVAARFFSPLERARLRAPPAPLRVEAFYRCWTRKEAHVKVVGSGLSVPLHDFDVTLVLGEPAALARVLDRPSEPRRWRMQSLPLPCGYLGAIVVGAGAA